MKTVFLDVVQLILIAHLFFHNQFGDPQIILNFWHEQGSK